MPPSTSPWARDDTGSNMVDRVQFHSRRGKGDFTRNDTHFAEPWATDLEDAGVPPPGFFGNGWKHPDKPPRHVPPSTLPYATDFLEPRHPDITLKPNQEKIHPSDFNKIHKHKLQSTGMAFLEQRAEESAGNFSQDARKDYLSELKAQMDGQKVRVGAFTKSRPPCSARLLRLFPQATRYEILTLFFCFHDKGGSQDGKLETLGVEHRPRARSAAEDFRKVRRRRKRHAHNRRFAVYFPNPADCLLLCMEYSLHCMEYRAYPFQSRIYKSRKTQTDTLFYQLQELKHVVKHPRVIAAFQLPRSMNHEEIEEFIEEIDINGDGVIDFDEFIAFIDAKAGDRAQMSEADKANLAKSGPGSHSLRRMKNEL